MLSSQSPLTPCTRIGVLSFLTLSAAALQPTILTVSQGEWIALNVSVGGRLHNDGRPMASACYSNPPRNGSIHDQFNSQPCLATRHSYQNHLYRAAQFGGYMNPPWEGCQASSEFCLLDYRNTSDTSPIQNSRQCLQGSVPEWYVDVRNPTDASAVFAFSLRTRVPLVIKNSGHDFRGRSSGAHALGIWTHHLQNLAYHPEFVAEGCSGSSTKAITTGAGVGFELAYKFAEENGVTLLGGTDESVGISGGWVMGGGHGVLSPIFGLGADRVLQFKIVTPDGQYRTANACQNRDLFYALRGGGGGTFGVVIESTTTVVPRLTLQVAHFTFPSKPEALRKVYGILIEHAVRWAEQGFSLYTYPGAATLVTPLLNHSSAILSLVPLTEVARSPSVNGSSYIVQLPSMQSLYTNFIKRNQAVVGVPMTVTSRLVPRTNFDTPESREELLDTIMEASKTSFSPRLQGVTPILYKDDGKTSVHPAWRSSVWTVLFPEKWEWDSTQSEIKDAYDRSSRAVQLVRNITPGSGAYQNEADIFTKDPASEFWGPHYKALLRIKRKFDPHRLLDCYQCVGWRGRSDKRYGCYPSRKGMNE